YLILSSIFFIHDSLPLRYLHSFPTRRSSDLLCGSSGILPRRRRIYARLVTLGLSSLGNLLVVVYMYREPDIIRVISAWKANKRRSEEHTSELQSLAYLVCRLLLEKKKKKKKK